MKTGVTLDETYHYPPELLALLVDAVSVLCRSKRDVLTFLRGAGVPRALLRDLEERIAADRGSVKKHDIASTVLVRLNEAGESMLRQRREIVKRVTETESFASCWPDDVHKAKGLVAEVREIVNVKDSFTRMRLERERERAEAMRARQAERAAAAKDRAARERIRRDLTALFTLEDPQKRGRQLEIVLNQLFALDGISVRESFTVTSPEREGVVEQVDGVIELEGHLYLVEMKWLKERVGVGDVAQHLVRMFGRGEMRGVFISASGFAETAVATCRDALAQRVNILCGLDELVLLLERGANLKRFLKAKVEAAALDKQPLFKPSLE